MNDQIEMLESISPGQDTATTQTLEAPDQPKKFRRRSFVKLAAASIAGSALGVGVNLKPSGIKGIFHFISNLGRTAIETPPHIEADSNEPHLLDFIVWSPSQAEAAEMGNQGDFVVEGPMLQAYQEYGGIAAWGKALSNSWTDKDGVIRQAFVKGVFEKKPAGISWQNIYDDISRIPKPDQNLQFAPDSLDWSSDNGLPWGHDSKGGKPGTIEQNHFDKIFVPLKQTNPELEEFYFKNPFWFEQYGLPVSYQDFGGLVVVRCQRTILQLWKDKRDWTTKPREVVASNAGQDAINNHLVPTEALNAQAAAATAELAQAKSVTPEIKAKAEPTKIFISQTISADQKVLADRLQAEVQKSLVELGLNGLVAEIEIADRSDGRLRANHSYGTRVTMDNIAGFAGIYFPDYNKIILSANTDPKNIARLLGHEELHAMDPRFGNVQRLLTDEERRLHQDKFNISYQAYRRNNLIPGKYASFYDREIWTGLFIEIGEAVQGDFLDMIGLPQYKGLGIPHNELNNTLNRPLHPILKTIISNYLQEASSRTIKIEYMSTEDLGQKIAQGFWQQGENFLTVFNSKKDLLKGKANDIDNFSFTEAWAKLGERYLEKDPNLVQEFPEFYAAFEYISPLLKSKLTNFN